ncbi:MAG: hypothetical protein RBT42_14490 [Aquabacterium sp.]|nr:hypothetical protein [Aquabacterium sp.]
MSKTESAVRKLFEGIDSYTSILKRHPTAVFVTSYTNEADFHAQYEAWARENESQIRASLEAEREYMAESFAQATFCGAILQVAAKAIECFSKNTSVPEDWSAIVKVGTKAVPFCAGRLIRDVPLGLVIHAARNQHTHFDDDELREPNISVFERLAVNHGIKSGQPFRDPAFDIQNTRLVSYASNCTALMGWRTYEAYEQDMHALLEI